VSAGQPAPKASEFSDDGVPFIRAGSLDSLLSGGTEADCEKISEDTAKRNRLRLYPKDTVVFAKSGMSATLGRVYRLRQPAYVVSHLAALAPTEAYDPAFLMYWLRQNSPAHLIKDAAYPSIRISEIQQLKVPRLEITDQRRVAAILDKADSIRRRREQALTIADDFLKSAFVNMYGDPSNNPSLPQAPLAEVASFVSGATPSKARPEYWNGSFPWVSPKDMKSDVINDTQDHVSDLAFSESNLKRIPSGTPLIVVRGMILVHTVPIAITSREVAINQDIKAITFDNRVDPTFGLWCLRVQHENLLSRVDTAAHGTKRLDMERLGSVPIHIPDRKSQIRFVSLARTF
jgi:type I restriction enzyme S subunit